MARIHSRNPIPCVVRFLSLILVLAHLQATLADDIPSGEVPDIAQRTHGIDWPDFLGPSRNSKSPETGIITDWSASGLRIVWQRDLGEGYAMGSVARGRYFQFCRFGDKARIYCLQSETGKELWRFEYDTDYEDLLGYNNGPRCTPVVDGDRVYAFGVEGMLHCLRVTDGKFIWARDTTEDYGVVQNFFGVGSTPLVVEDLLIAMVGGSPPNSPTTYSGRVRGNGSGVVAFDKFTGEEKYRLTDELASYASPIHAKIAGRPWCFVFARGGLIGFDPRDGELDFHYPWRSKLLESVNAATPIAFDGRVFITETYGVGSSLLRVTAKEHQVIWRDNKNSREKAMMAHWNTPIYHDGYIYASSGRHTRDAELRCIRASDGKIQWNEPRLTRCSLLYIDQHLVCLGEYGRLILLRATPDKYDVVTEMTPMTENGSDRLFEYPAWSAPFVSHGLLYVRGNSRLVCYELTPPTE